MRIQKGKVRFSKRELWNLDETLKPIIHTALTQFSQEKKYGVSMLAYEDCISSDKGITIDEAKAWIKENQSNSGEVDGYTTEMIFDYFNNVIIQDMIFAFANHPDYDDIEKPPYKISMNMDGEVREDGTVKSFIEYEWDRGITQEDVNAYGKRERQYDEMVADRCVRGRHLFARFFNSLWD